MTWAPGRPVVNPSDWAEYLAWRRARILLAQRDRRKRYRRIDYYPSDEAARIIDGLTFPGPDGDLSRVISRIVEEWAASGI